MNKFEFEIIHGGVSYHCLCSDVKHGLDYLYVLDLKTAGTTGKGDRISIRPVHSDCAHWKFTCKNGEYAQKYYPSALLEKLGEEIDQHNLRFIV
jgi:hypothetical protein